LTKLRKTSGLGTMISFLHLPGNKDQPLLLLLLLPLITVQSTMLLWLMLPQLVMLLLI